MAAGCRPGEAGSLRRACCLRCPWAELLACLRAGAAPPPQAWPHGQVILWGRIAAGWTEDGVEVAQPPPPLPPPSLLLILVHCWLLVFGVQSHTCIGTPSLVSPFDRSRQRSPYVWLTSGW